MATDLSISEQEDKEAERLLNKKPPHSRKYTERRAPRHQDRRRRVKLDDPDTKKTPPSKSSVGFITISSIGATSNKIISNKSMKKFSTYHGVTGQGHPSGHTNTEYKSLDKRYFGNDHYDSIIRYAENLLNEDWFKYAWDETSDARYRAALDLSIHMADNNLYQAKIDAETYNLLLNRLANWNYDSFAETITPQGEKRKRSATDMNKENVVNIIRVANDLRHVDPKASFEIIKNLRALVSSEVPIAPSIGQHVAQEDEEQDEEQASHIAPTGQQEQQSQKDCSQQEQQSGNKGDVLNFGEELSPDMKHHVDGVKKALEPFNFDDDELDSFLAHLEEKVTGKTASVMIPFGLAIRFAHAHPEARPILLPILAAAKKKKKDNKSKGKAESKSKEKISQQSKKKKKAPPFGGKKAPPFGGKKASNDINNDDMTW